MLARAPLVLASLTLATSLSPGSGTADGSAGAVQAPSRAEMLFDAQCALCHGGRGEADGPASFLLFPPARDFARGHFKLAGTANGVPSDDDLVATLRRGIPGSAMPSWSWMPDEDLRALAQLVRELAVEGMAEDLYASGAGGMEACRARATARMTPGEHLAFDDLAAGEGDLALGRRLFAAHCASCHGEDGKGRHDVLRRDADETRNWARDFTSGILKGGASREELARRILVGLHGTAMPWTDFAPEELSALVGYVRSLIPEDAEDRLVQRREQVRAVRVPDGALEEAAEIDWSAAEDVELVLAPLWWRDGAILRANVSALHDGRSLSVRVRWKDPVPDAPRDLEWPLEAPLYADAVALQLAADLEPPYFGMGEGADATNLWHWRAVHVPGFEDLQVALRWLPHRVGDWLTEAVEPAAPLYLIATGPLLVAGETVAVVPAGMRLAKEQEPVPSSVSAHASWNDGEWDVVFTRALEPESSAEVPLAPAGRVSLNLALWNGAIRDLRGQKSVSIWHVLELDA